MWHGIVQGQARRPPGRHRLRDPEVRREQRLLGGARVLRPRHRPQLPRRAAGAALRQARHAGGAGARHDLHHRADDQRRPPRREGVRQRRLDHRHQGPFAVGAVGAHGAGHRNRLRGADPVGRQPAAAGLRATPADAADRSAWPPCATPLPRQRRAWPTLRARLPRRQGRAARALRASAADARHPHACCSALARHADAHAASSCGSTPACPPASRWWPSAASAAASCSRIPTSTCWCCCPTAPRADARRRPQAPDRGLHRQLLGHRPGDRLQRAHGDRVRGAGATAT